MEKRNAQQPSSQDILDAITEFATGIENDMAELKQDVNALKRDVSGLKQDVSGLKQDVSGLKQDVSGLKLNDTNLMQDVAYLKNNMVTKSYLDDKFFKWSGDNREWLRAEDDKVNALAGVLAEKKCISRPAAQRVVAMGPFGKR